MHKAPACELRHRRPVRRLFARLAAEGDLAAAAQSARQALRLFGCSWLWRVQVWVQLCFILLSLSLQVLGTRGSPSTSPGGTVSSGPGCRAGCGLQAPPGPGAHGAVPHTVLTSCHETGLQKAHVQSVCKGS